jgi:hypothetical protein
MAENPLSRLRSTVNLQLPSVAEIDFRTIYRPKPFLSRSRNWQLTYNCLPWPESTTHGRKPIFLAVVIDSQSFIQLQTETLLNLSLAVAIDSDLQLPLARINLRTIHGWKPFSLAVAIDSDLQLPLWLESTYVQRWSFLSRSCNRHSTYDCLCGWNRPFVRFTAETLTSLAVAINIQFTIALRSQNRTTHSRKPSFLAVVINSQSFVRVGATTHSPLKQDASTCGFSTLFLSPQLLYQTINPFCL